MNGASKKYIALIVDVSRKLFPYLFDFHPPIKYIRLEHIKLTENITVARPLSSCNLYLAEITSDIRDNNEPITNIHTTIMCNFTNFFNSSPSYIP